MPATYLGSTTVGGAVVGLNVAFGTVGSALADLRLNVEAQLAIVAQAKAGLELQVGATAAAKLAIRLVAVADFQAQLDASLAIQTNLGVNITDPVVYFQGLVDGLLKVQATLQSLLALPAPEMTASFGVQLSASLAVSAMLTAKIAAVDVELELLVAISLALNLIVDALLSISASLTAAISAVVGVLSAYASLTVQLGVAGVHVLLYTGPLSGIGAAVDAVTGSIGIAGAVDVRVPIVLIETSDPSRVAALNAVFKTS